ncbi:MAG: 3-dehydroquinate synthase [Bryobacterales bacterium]|nr:3-dehydroquinate synthase [Bryobacterales bacterium]
MHRIPVKTAASTYDVIVEGGCLDRAGEYVRPVVGERRVFILADEGAWAAQGERLERGLQGLRFEAMPVKLGEDRKRLAVVEELSERMHERGADRSAAVLAFGGGIAGDVGGFVAASYMRGVDVIQCPTTLLAQVDAAVGGKTGVNLPTGKNLVGAFHQPRLVLMDPTTLESLPARELGAGLYEVIKHGIIWNSELFERMAAGRDGAKAGQADLLEYAIAESVRIKGEVVEKDEKEGGLRRILNYGHTLGHALEAETGYKRLLHGEAVAWGMIAAGRLGEAVGTIGAAERARIEDVILSYGPIPSLEGLDAEKIAARVAGDKKTIGGKVHFVLPEAIGRVIVLNGIPHQKVIEAAQAALAAVTAGAAA